MRLRFAFRRYARPFRQPLRTGQGPWSTREGLILRIEAENGRVGWGEAAPIPWFKGATLDELCARFASLGDITDDDTVRSAAAVSGAAGFAVETALTEAPVTPTQTATALPVAALLPAGAAARAVLAARAEAGFRTFKWKVGVGDPADELALLDDLLGDLPKNARLRLDANGAWDRRTAERWLSVASERPIEFIEQPTPAFGRGARDLLLGLAQDFPVPLALDESLGDEQDVREWLDAGWPGFWILKLPLFARPEDILAQLRRRSARWVFSSALEGPVARQAVWRLIFSQPDPVPALGYGLGDVFGDRVWDGPPPLPFWRFSDGPSIAPEALWNALS